MPTPPEVSQTEHELLGVMRAGDLGGRGFDSLAARVFALQYTHNQPYRSYCRALGVSPAGVARWQDIPAVSTDAFKEAAFPLSVGGHARSRRVFLTSGTTADVRGRHVFPSLALYEASILAMWKTLRLPRPETVVMLTPRPEDAPHSSLSHMMGVLAGYYRGANVVWAIDKYGGMDLEKLAAPSGPTAVLGTALAFLHLFENTSLPLPGGSFAMETGGYKGTRRSMEKAELYALFEEKLALPPDSVVNEYSMTELSSQFYSRGLAKPHRAPPWVRTRVIDPRTGADAEPGQPGHLAICDLANLYSVAAVQTQDLALAGENGSFTLLGRDPSALPRGCSRAADDTLP